MECIPRSNCAVIAIRMDLEVRWVPGIQVAVFGLVINSNGKPFV
jgi:hypothetical protein